MNKTTWWKRAALWTAGLVCAAGALAGCTTSRDQYRESSNISTYGVVDVALIILPRPAARRLQTAATRH